MRIMRWAIPLLLFVIIGAVGYGVYNGVREIFPRNLPETTSHPDEKPFALKVGVLEVSSVTSQETFNRKDPLKFWRVNFGTTISQLKVKAIYRYHVPLNPNGWHVMRAGEQFRVIAPAVQPTLPIAIDTSTLEKETSSGWFRFNKTENLEALERDLTSQLEKRTSQHIELQRPKARQAATEFVVTWMLKQQAFAGVKASQVHVFFADEAIGTMDSASTNF